jgi:glycerol-3-phosphate O-acyltransferase
LAYVDDVKIVGENKDTIQKNTKALLDASKEVGLEVNPEKTMLMSHCQRAGQRHSIKRANRSFEDVAKFRHLGTTLTDQNMMHEEIKSRQICRMLVTIRFRVIIPPAVQECKG